MKKIDLMNFFYSIGAVVILIGVIAKFLEWKSQDALLLAGLSVEALVFTFSSIQPKPSTVVYKWENIFPELISDEHANTITNTQERYNYLMSMYIEFLETSINSFKTLNSSTIENSNKFNKVVTTSIIQFEESIQAISNLKASINEASRSISDFPLIESEVTVVINNFRVLNEKFNKSNIPMEELNYQVVELKETLSDFARLGNGILGQFRSLDKK